MLDQTDKTIQGRLQQEFAIIEEEVPGFASVLLEAIEQGRIIGDNFIAPSSTGDEIVGCAYGTINGYDTYKACRHVSKVIERMEYPWYKSTPLEYLITDVNEGDTEQNSDELKILFDALHLYQDQLHAKQKENTDAL